MGFAGRIGAAGLACGLGVAALGGSAARAPAQPAPPPEPSAAAGRVLVERFCTNCHAGETPGGTVPVGTPSLRAIANLPEQTAERIAGFLIQPHAPMPDMQLTRQEIQDVVAYLDTLRSDRDKPLLPPPAGQKPKLPSPS